MRCSESLSAIGGNKRVTGILKRDEAAIEQVIDRGSEEQAVAGGEPFLVGGFPPRLDVARDEMHGVRDLCHQTARFVTVLSKVTSR